MEFHRIPCLAHLTKVRQETCKNSLFPDRPETPGGEKVSSRTKMSQRSRAAGARLQPCTVVNKPSSSILQACTYLPYSATTPCFHCNHHRLTSLCESHWECFGCAQPFRPSENTRGRRPGWTDLGISSRCVCFRLFCFCSVLFALQR